MKKIHKYRILYAVLVIVSFFLLLSNSYVELNITSKKDMLCNISYITPFDAYYDKNKPKPFNIQKGNNIYKVNISGKMIKKLRVGIEDDNSSNIVINSIGVKLFYLPLINFTDINPQVLSNSIEYRQISKILIVVPILISILFIISFVLLIRNMLQGYPSIINIIKLRQTKIIVFILLFIIIYEYAKFIGFSFLISHIFNTLDFLSYFQVFKNDSYILSIFILSLYGMIAFQNKAIKIILFLFAFLLLFINIVDFAVLKIFVSRFRFIEAEALDFNANIMNELTKSFFMDKLGCISLVLIISIVSYFIYALKNTVTFTKPYKYILFIFALMLYPLFLIPDKYESPVFSKLYASLLSIQIPENWKVHYSQEKIDYINNNFHLEYTCVKGENQKKDVIVVIVESLSSYTSKFFNGIYNKTPILDKIASENISVKEFYSNNYNTSRSMIGFTTGNPLLHNPYNFISFNNMKLYKDTFIKDFRNNGYKTVIFNSAEDFESLKFIFDNSGFEVSFFGDNDIYKGREKYLFNGVNDQALYDVVFKYYDEYKNKSNQPIFIVTKNVITHKPYYDPVTKHNNFDLSFSYAEKELYNFIENLKSINYFDNGIVVITGDHRAMEIILQEEFNSLGHMAAGRIPLIIIDGKSNYSIDGSFALTDLGKSLAYLMLDKVCFNQYQKNIFDTSFNSKACTIFQNGLKYDIVSVKCNGEYADIKLDGDNTRIVNGEGNLSQSDIKSLLDYIAYLRIQDK